MEESQKQKVGHLMYVASKVAQQQGLGEGFRVVVNNGKDSGKLC